MYLNENTNRIQTGLLSNQTTPKRERFELGLLVLKGPCSPKWLCALVLLFGNVSLVECSVLIGSHFPSDNFHLREILAMHSG